ncbi:uncharacterized protein BX664DRAFT_389105 [Halteromyces radiatus]|uniref:uncharacterized protein n=1 Tax=Halteromyces radiatus TaxID=101107 RepID=UPI0022205CEF|nr:uncharacterized protein BX664DRAFT_389105 [Halteromyces radiatus]KAI8078710.1 hypothetical protein BX664DRAFT_389105 [Halteromyces radiatus]
MSHFETDSGNATSLPPVQFNFTPEEFDHLQLASGICTYMSMISIAVVVAVYWYMLYHHPRDTNRVSLRCVIGANVVSFMDHCMALAAAEQSIHTQFCFSWRFLNGIFTMMPICLLGCVGVHLFLVFVYRIRWPCRPEYILMPAAAVYTGIANIIPYYGEELPEGIDQLINPNAELCWYYNGFADRTYNKPAWIYYYSFIFLVIIISSFTSIASMYKVFLDKRKNTKLLLEIAERGLGSASTSQQRNEASSSTRGRLSPASAIAPKPPAWCQVQQTKNPFRKVVARSLLYPLMPAVTYSLGFTLQMYLIDPEHQANFVLALMSVIMARLAGVFVAGIFFSDPTVQTIPGELWRKCTTRKPEVPQIRSTAPSARTSTLIDDHV